MSTDTAPKTRTITLTDRHPVKIIEADWPVLARGDSDSWTGGDYARYQQAASHGEIDDYKLIVRQHEDGRTLVYGILDAADSAWGAPARGESWRGGVLLHPHAAESGVNYRALDGHEIAAAIREVGESGGLPDAVIRACIAGLPAEEL